MFNASSNSLWTACQPAGFLTATVNVSTAATFPNPVPVWTANGTTGASDESAADHDGSATSYDGAATNHDGSATASIQVFTLPAVVLTLLVTLLILEPDNVQVEECSGNEGATMEC